MAAPPALFVQEPRNHLFAGAAFAREQDGRTGRRHRVHQMHDVRHRSAAVGGIRKDEIAGQFGRPAEVRQRQRRGCRNRIGRSCVFFPLLERGIDDLLQFIEFDRFGHEVESPLLDRRYRIFNRAVGGQQDAGRRILLLPHGLKHVHAAAVRHPEVGQNQVEFLLCELFERGSRRRRPSLPGTVCRDNAPSPRVCCVRRRRSGVSACLLPCAPPPPSVSAVPPRCRGRPAGTPRNGAADRRGSSRYGCISVRCRSAVWRLHCAAGPARPDA